MSDVDTGALGASGRFARMEAALDRIELKLDLKADQTALAGLEAKHNALETLISDMSTGKIVTPLSAMYLEQFNSLKKSVEAMEDEDRGRAAVLAAAKGSSDQRFNRLAWAVGIMSVISMLVSVGAAIATVIG